MKIFPKLKNKFILAPMAGITNPAFRELCQKYGCSFAYTEMVSANALARSAKAANILIKKTEDEKNIGLQLFGQNTENFVKSIKKYQENFDLIDINFGCPSLEIIQQGAGSALLIRKNKIKEIIEKCVSCSDIPITAKIRSGIDEKRINFLEIGKIIEDAGASAITLHPRTAKQAYAGISNWDHIKQLKEELNIPVIGNGDINKPEDAKKMIEQTNCDYVMIGRATRGNPRIFKECIDYFNKKEYSISTKEDRIKQLNEYLDLCEKYKSEFSVTKTNAMYFSKGIKGGTKIRLKLNRVKEIIEIREVFKNA
jgi:nifR3 family TIM-barrel protein